MRCHDLLPVRLLTHNIRYATDSPVGGEEEWSVRRMRMINELRFNTAHCDESFICLQEVLHRQLIDILNGLNGERKGEWDFIGVGRDDGVRDGEFSPIVYRCSTWLLESWETVWLSETPDKPSRGWDAACNRILTIGIFRHRHSKKKLVAMNTHLDHQGAKSRLEAAKIILGQIGEKSQQGQQPVFLAGDFNSQQDDDAYSMLTNEASPMKDLYTLSSSERRYGHYYTFTGFGSDKPARIDFLFVNQKVHPWLVQDYAVLENKFDDEVYASDHRAVAADAAFR
ncbi:MAG: hypothetical protein LQ338_000258 [Usnochroma carphineum]|nr:MAG: hypothetical protein LQ338_000258 [Usnochroma carphineum]